mgnify:CR=1 FL=1
MGLCTWIFDFVDWVMDFVGYFSMTCLSYLLSLIEWCIQKSWSSFAMFYNCITLHITIVLIITLTSLHLFSNRHPHQYHHMDSLWICDWWCSSVWPKSGRRPSTDCESDPSIGFPPHVRDRKQGPVTTITGEGSGVRLYGFSNAAQRHDVAT